MIKPDPTDLNRQLSIYALRELSRQSKGRDHYLKARVGQAPKQHGCRWVLDTVTQEALDDSRELIKDILNLPVSSLIIARAAIRHFQEALADLKYTAVMDRQGALNLEEKEQFFMDCVALREALYKAALKKVGS